MTGWVVDAGPLIFLAKIQRLPLLYKSADELWIPDAVWDEVHSISDESTEAIAALEGEKLQRRTVGSSASLSLLSRLVDPGEAEVLALAQEAHADRVVLDDLDARRLARQLGLTMVGTIGILLAAKLRGDIPSLHDEIHRLETHGFFISHRLRAAVLKEADEA